jgi:hypothetical protein
VKESIEKIKEQWEDAGASVSQGEAPEYIPQKPKMTSAEEELIERALADRASIEGTESL